MTITRKDFTKETLEKMKSITRKTKDVEMGFVFCKTDDGKISFGQPICTGKSCSIYTGESKCKPNEEDIGSFHTHPTNDIVSVGDLVHAHDQDIMYLGRKTLFPIPPFDNRVDCYTVIDRKSKKYADKILEDLDRIKNNTWSMVENNQISSQDAHIILNNEYDKHVKKLLPLFNTFKI